MPCRGLLLKGALSFALLVGLAGCPVPKAGPFPCLLDSDCAEGFACVDDLCRGGAPLPDAGRMKDDAGHSDAGKGADAGRTDAGPHFDAGTLDGGSDGGHPSEAGDDGGSATDGGDDDDAGELADGGGDDGGDGGSDAGPSFPAPIHHWPFDDPEGETTIMDIVGGAHGQAYGTASDGSGGLFLDGEGAYVDLPNGIISPLRNATFEVWLRWYDDEEDDDRNWERVFDFGTNTHGELGPGEGDHYTGTSYLFVTPRNRQTSLTRFGVTLNGNAPGAEHTLDAPLIAGDGELTHIVVVYDSDDATVSLYTNGLLQDTMALVIELEAIDDNNNWLGRSNWKDDPYLHGVLEDFRIYDVALTDGEVMESYFADVPMP